MILVVSFPGNEHVDAVCEHLTAPPVIVDTASFPVALGLSATLTRSREKLDFVLPDGRELCLCRVGAVWYRRISAYGLDPAMRDATSRLFAWSEANEALLGVWYSLNCFWMNPPSADEVAQRKIHQLQVARRLGLSIPDTLVTNRPQAARAFVEEHGVGRVIRKAFRNIPQAPRETHVLEHDDLVQLESVRLTPVTFQRFIPATLDLRVTIVEDDLFAAAVTSEDRYRADYRPGLATATVTPYELPSTVAEQLMALMKVLNLQFGAIDLRLTPDGDYVFLEVNPAGEFLFVSRRTGQPIAQAIAASLERHDRAHPDCAPC